MWFRKKKEFLIDHFGDGITDIHNHLLPGLDDGSPDMETTLEMIHLMRECNVTNAYVTPHIMEDFYDLNLEEIRQKFDITKKSLGNIPEVKDFLIDYSSEYMIDNQFESLIRKKKLKPVFKNFPLTELSYFQAPNNLDEILFNMTALGHDPILAHPERYRYVEDYKQFERWKKKGFLFQLNLLSLSGHYGSQAFKKAEYLLQHDLYDFVGTDAHKVQHLKVLKNTLVEKKNIKPVQSLIDRHQSYIKQ